MKLFPDPEYSTRLSDAAAEGLRAEDARAFAGSGRKEVEPSEEKACEGCGYEHEHCQCGKGCQWLCKDKGWHECGEPARFRHRTTTLRYCERHAQRVRRYESLEVMELIAIPLP